MASGRDSSANIDYANGSPALRLNNGAGFAYYHSEPGEDPAVACCISKVDETQLSFFFYDKAKPSKDKAWTRGGAPKAPLLCCIDEHVVGFAHNNTGKHEGIVPGVECCGYLPWPGKLNICKRCGRTSGEHATGEKLVLTKAGAVLADDRGIAVKKWLWDPLKQGAGTPPKDPIAFPLNRWLSFEYRDRATIRVTFKCESVHRVFECGERLKHTSNYLDKVSGTEIGALRGKKIIDVDAPTLLQRQAEASKLAASSRTRDNASAVRDSSVSGALADLSKACDTVSGIMVTPFSSAGWRESALERTLSEAPKFNLGTTSVSLGRTSNLLSSAGGATLSRTTGSAATPGDTVEGYGTTTGIAMHKGKWLGELDVKSKLATVHPILPRPAHLKDASGRYCVDVPVEGRDTVFKKLPRVTAAGFDEFITKTVAPDQLVLVACLRDDDPQCRRVTQVMEHVNGTLASRYPGSPQYVTALSPEEDLVDGRPCPYWLVKYDMAESRFLVKRYNVQTLPCFLAFYNGKLVYGGLMGGSTIIKLPACGATVNFLVMEPDPASQMKTEKVLRVSRTPSDLAAGTFDSSKGKVVNVLASALAHITRLAESAARRHRDAPSRSKAVRGNDAAGAIASNYSVVLASSSVPTADMHELAKRLQQRHRTASGNNSATVPGSTARLTGPSLLVNVLPIGSVLPGNHVCSVCEAVASTSRRHKPAATPAADPDGTSEPWACPRCGTVQRATRDLLADGACSLAVVKPVKPHTVLVLSRLWGALQTPGASAGAGSEATPTFTMGLTHDVVMERLASMQEQGQRGKYLPSGWRLGVAVAAAETTLRGEPLTR